MNFSLLAYAHQTWKDIRVIGKTIERDSKKYHMVGMTLSSENTAFLYIIEPFIRPTHFKRKGTRNQRQRLKENEENEICYLQCREFLFGRRKLKAEGGNGGPLRFSEQDYRTIQLFLDMISAGWVIPEWLKETDWEDLQLTTLHFSDIKRLPNYSPGMPITIKHRPDPVRHIVEKTVMLYVGKSRTFRFTNHRGEEVQCYINNVSLIDVWKDFEEQFSNPKYTKKFSPDQLQQIKEHCIEALRQNCPKGAHYIGIEYECSKDLQLQFYTKEYLKSFPETHSGSASFLLMHLKPDKKTGIHGLSLKGAVIPVAVSPDIAKISAELFSYFEKAKEWEETVQ